MSETKDPQVGEWWWMTTCICPEATRCQVLSIGRTGNFIVRNGWQVREVTIAYLIAPAEPPTSLFRLLGRLLVRVFDLALIAAIAVGACAAIRYLTP